MKISAGAPFSIWRARAELAAYDTFRRRPVARSAAPARSSRAVCSEEAAKTSTSFVCGAATAVPASTMSRMTRVRTRISPADGAAPAPVPGLAWRS